MITLQTDIDIMFKKIIFNKKSKIKIHPRTRKINYEKDCFFC